MNLEKKLSQWRDAGLIDEPTSARIAGFEQARERPIVLYALGGLGALTLAIGIISVVAANWDAIPRATKLGLDLTVGVALALALFRSVSRDASWVSDVLAGVYYGYVLGSLALLGQVYQLGAPEYQALLTWSLVTAPFMCLVRGRLLGAFWLAGLVTTHSVSFVELFDWLDHVTDLNDEFAMNLTASLSFASLLGYIVIARTPFFVRQRPQVSVVWTRMLWTSLLVAGCGVCFAFYADIDGRDKLSWSVAVCGALAAGMYALLPKLYPDVSARGRHGMGLLLGLIWLVLATGTTFDRPSMSALGAILQVALLGVAAWTVLALGSVRGFNLLTALIALRVLVMYFEVFGSMLDTGLGMISGGLLTLLLAWVWKRKSPELAERFGAQGAPTHAS